MPAIVVEAAILSLLDREPRETILPAFDVSVTKRYFRDFEERLPDYFTTEQGAADER